LAVLPVSVSINRNQAEHFSTMCISSIRFTTGASRKSRRPEVGRAPKAGTVKPKVVITNATMERRARRRWPRVPTGESMTITAKYEDGVFKPLEDVSISEGTIVEVRVPSYADRLKGKARSVGDFAFYGMWKDRTDIADSVEYISNLRRDLRG
jgi:predicted DNA-binding antitoxin AbrB/MazE fold protein